MSIELDTIADLKAQLLGATANNEGLRRERDEAQGGYDTMVELRDAALRDFRACTALLEERTKELEQIHEALGADDEHATARDAVAFIQQTFRGLQVGADVLDKYRAKCASLESENAGLRERVTVLESQWQLEQRLKLDAYADGNALRERVTRLEGTLRSEIVDYGVNVKHTGEHYSLCGICEARGPEEEEPPHKSDCVLFSAALSDAPPAATVEGLGQSSYAVPTVDCAGCAKVACHPGEGLVCVLHYAPPASKAKP